MLSRISAKRAWAGASGCLSFKRGSAMARALGPERRTMPMPPRPGGVEMATMVSCESSTSFKCNLGIFFVGGEGAFLQGVLRNASFFAWFFVVKLW